jgi:hypothetical protein
MSEEKIESKVVRSGFSFTDLIVSGCLVGAGVCLFLGQKISVLESQNQQLTQHLTQIQAQMQGLERGVSLSK